MYGLRAQTHSIGYKVILASGSRVEVDFVPMVHVGEPPSDVFLVADFDKGKWVLTASPLIAGLPNKMACEQDDLRWVIRALKTWKKALCTVQGVPTAEGHVEDAVVRTPVPPSTHMEVFARQWYGTLQTAGVEPTRMTRYDKLQSALKALAMHLDGALGVERTPCLYPGHQSMVAWWDSEAARPCRTYVADPHDQLEMRDLVPAKAHDLLARIAWATAECLPPQLDPGGVTLVQVPATVLSDLRKKAQAS